MLVALLLAVVLQGETIAAIQVHGNTVSSDAEILRLAGVEVGSPLQPTTVDDVAKRLREARRFENVQVLKRFASISDPSQILLVIIVDEGPVRIEMTGDPDRPAQTVRNRRPRVLFLPVLSAEDGYGVTYGARFAWPDPAGDRSRISTPLTWGGDKKAAVEFEKAFATGPFDRITAAASVSRRTNPFFDQDDDRIGGSLRGERTIVPHLRLGATAATQRITFPLVVGGPRRSEVYPSAGADATLDTRIDPVLPRNAIYARAGWEHIAGVNRLDLDARGYIGLVRQSVIALRALRSDADGPLPLSLEPLLGGLANLRGFAAGTGVGDTLVATSAEIIVPLTSPLSIGRLGVSAFVDTGTVYRKGQRLEDQEWLRGVGSSVWLSAAFVRLNFAVAHGVGSSTRLHFGATVAF